MVMRQPHCHRLRIEKTLIQALKSARHRREIGGTWTVQPLLETRRAKIQTATLWSVCNCSLKLELFNKIEDCKGEGAGIISNRQRVLEVWRASRADNAISVDVNDPCSPPWYDLPRGQDNWVTLLKQLSKNLDIEL